jgi:hypothetical protein
MICISFSYFLVMIAMYYITPHRTGIYHDVTHLRHVVPCGIGGSRSLFFVFGALQVRGT